MIDGANQILNLSTATPREANVAAMRRAAKISFVHVKQ
jgi:hypothetical protein